MKPMRLRIAEILYPSHKSDPMSRGFNIFIMTLIFLNVIAVILETMDRFAETYHGFFKWFEVVSIAIFSVEYGLRLWACVEKPQYEGLKGRLRYSVTPLLVLDLLAILPFYLPMIFPFDLRFLRILRLTTKSAHSMNLLVRALINKKGKLLITLLKVLILLVIVSSLIYFIESNAQPEVFSSIPAAMWWSIGATTRLGPGPINPITDLGMVFGSMVAILGLGVFALPAGILASGLIEEIKHKPSGPTTCPNCGNKLD